MISWKALLDYRKGQDFYMLELEEKITSSISTWIAGRVTSVNTPKILPRNLTVFAHENPIYFIQNNKPLYEEVSVTYLRSVKNWIEKNSIISTEPERQEAWEHLEKAEQVLSDLSLNVK